MRAAGKAADGMDRAPSHTAAKGIRAPRRRASDGSAAKRHGRAIRSVIALAALALAAAGAPAVLPASAAAEQCPNAQFRTGPSTHLPDCRAYEMVTPPYKGSGFLWPVALAANGTTFLTEGTQAFNGAEGFPNVFKASPAETYTTRRTPAGWTSVPQDPPATEYIPFTEKGFLNYAGDGGESPNGMATVWMARAVWQAENRIDFFMRDADRSIVDIGPALPPSSPDGPPLNLGIDAGLHALGLSADGSHYFFSLRGDYWPGDETANKSASLYEYVGTGNTTPLLVGVDNSGKLISQCGTELGGVPPEPLATSNSNHNSVSADGNTVFFTAHPPSAACSASGPPVLELFARIDNGLSGAHTVAISEPAKEDCAACDTEANVLANAYFEGASADGSKVFFTTTQPLLGGDGSTNVYEYDFDAPAGERLIRVSSGDATVSNPAAEVIQLARGESPLNSEDGSHVYFIARGVLTKTSNVAAEAAEAGANNLYVVERDARFPAGRIAFIARLSARDLTYGVSLWSPNVTPDGRFLVFVSERDLTPDDTSSGVRQVFEYDAQTGSLVRVSVGREGYNDDGNVTPTFYTNHEVANDARIVSPFYGSPSNPDAYWTNLSVSADGSYVFFQSTVGLTPQAFNEKAIGRGPGGLEYANNVYEYHDGRVSLISDGQDVNIFTGELEPAVQLLGADASGGNVYFTSMDHLVGQDTDTNVDIYDARIDGGFPAPAQSQSCSGDACQGPLSAVPTLLSPGSEFQAGGNPPLTAEEVTPKAMAKPKKQKPKAKTKRGSNSRRKGRTARRAALGRGIRKGGRR